MPKKKGYTGRSSEHSLNARRVSTKYVGNRPIRVKDIRDIDAIEFADITEIEENNKNTNKKQPYYYDDSYERAMNSIADSLVGPNATIKEREDAIEGYVRSNNKILDNYGEFIETVYKKQKNKKN